MTIYHKCDKGCKGLSLEFCSRGKSKKVKTPCKQCGKSVEYGELALYPHLYRNTQAGQSGWYHIKCGKELCTRSEIAKRANTCRLTEEPISKGDEIIKMKCGNQTLTISVLKSEFAKFVTQSEEDMARNAGDSTINTTGKKFAMEKMTVQDVAPYLLDDNKHVRKAATKAVKRKSDS